MANKKIYSTNLEKKVCSIPFRLPSVGRSGSLISFVFHSISFHPRLFFQSNKGFFSGCAAHVFWITLKPPFHWRSAIALCLREIIFGFVYCFLTVKIISLSCKNVLKNAHSFAPKQRLCAIAALFCVSHAGRFFYWCFPNGIAFLDSDGL